VKFLFLVKGLVQGWLSRHQKTKEDFAQAAGFFSARVLASCRRQAANFALLGHL